MIKISVAGNDKGLRAAIDTVLKKYRIGAVFCSPSGEAPDILVTGQGAGGTDCVSESTVIIADTRSAVFPQELRDNGNIIIGCSGSPADTLSLACRDREKLIAGLRRSIISLSGETVEPQEICIHASETVPLFHALAACAVVLLCCAEAVGEIRL